MTDQRLSPLLVRWPVTGSWNMTWANCPRKSRLISQNSGDEQAVEERRKYRWFHRLASKPRSAQSLHNSLPNTR
jgi:hypothetical protein